MIGSFSAPKIILKQNCLLPSRSTHFSFEGLYDGKGQGCDSGSSNICSSSSSSSSNWACQEVQSYDLTMSALSSQILRLYSVTCSFSKMTISQSSTVLKTIRNDYTICKVITILVAVEWVQFLWIEANNTKVVSKTLIILFSHYSN